jgi:hypothetical protein
VFVYANVQETHDAMSLVHNTVRVQTRIIENNQVGAQGLTEIWEEFLPDFLHEVSANAQNYVRDALDGIERRWRRDGRNNPLLADVLRTVDLLRDQLDDMRFPDL